MNNRELPRLGFALLLAAFLMGTPAASAGADNVAVPDAVLDNVAAPAAVLDNVAELPAEADFREPTFGEEPRPAATVADPIEPLNRAFFTFNDKAYYWVFKPVARAYNYVVHEDIRVSVRNFFSNLATPSRAVNNLLQGNLRATGTELARFAMNSTMGILGLFDTARDGFGIAKTEADLGQTLGKYGLGQGIYIVLPVLGPTTLRDAAGTVGDSFLDPVTYVDPSSTSIGLKTYRTENTLSLRIGMYEDLTEAAVDPYVAVRDAYIQNRARFVRGTPSPAD